MNTTNSLNHPPADALAASHTLGPWRVVGDSRVEASDSTLLAVVEWRGVRRAAYYSNARLIAAAPDMYAALEALEAWSYTPDIRVDPDTLNLVFGALAKARGEQE